MANEIKNQEFNKSIKQLQAMVKDKQIIGLAEKFYNLMKNNWPKEDKDLLPNYNIENIANNLLELIKNPKVTLNKNQF